MQEHTMIHKGRRVTYVTYHLDKPQVIVMIHGFRGTHHGLDLIARALPDYRIVVPDLPGFGDSQAFSNNEHNVASYVEFTHALIAHLKLAEPPILLGHSFGSIVASHYAVRYPSTIEKLILINPIGAPALEGPKAIMTRLAMFYYWLGRKLPEKASHAWLGAPPIVKIMSVTMAKTKDPKLRAYVHDQHLRHFSSFASPQVVAESFNASVTKDVAQKAMDITLPTLLIAGEKDDITPLKKQRALAKNISGAKLHVIKGVGHLIHYETPREAAQTIDDFIS